MRIDTGNIKWFEDLGIQNILEVGGKNANLGELKKISKKYNFNVPDGFAITTKSYTNFILYNKIDQKILNFIERINSKKNNLKDMGSEIRSLILL